jgi:hypothetical protein
MRLDNGSQDNCLTQLFLKCLAFSMASTISPSRISSCLSLEMKKYAPSRVFAPASIAVSITSPAFRRKILRQFHTPSPQAMESLGSVVRRRLAPDPQLCWLQLDPLQGFLQLGPCFFFSSSDSTFRNVLSCGHS